LKHATNQIQIGWQQVNKKTMKESIQWYEFIINNWTQVIFILGVIGYIIKLFIDWDIKKREISFSKIQESKLLEAKEFFKSYQSLRISLQNFLNQTEFGKHTDDIFNKIRVEIRENYVDFDYKCMTLKLFMESEDIKTIDKILGNCESIRMDIEKWHI
jgi:preprotein translocase subunit Sss1